MRYSRIVIIGSGVAAYFLAQELRRKHKSVEIVMLTQSQGNFYSKPLLSTAFSRNKVPEHLITATAAAMRTRLAGEIITESTVVQIVPSEKQIYYKDAEGGMRTCCYDALVLAYGAQPVTLPILADLQNVYAINQLEQYSAFRETLVPGEKVIIVGSGLVGCEFAQDLGAAGFPVTVVSLSDTPLSEAVPSKVGKALQAGLSEKLPITWKLKQTIQSARQEGKNSVLLLSGGERISAEKVLSAVGLSVDASLPQTAGIALNQGIQVNDRLETSIAGIYALGDCAQIGNRCYRYVAPILQSARVLSQILLGDDTIKMTLQPTPIVVKTASYPLVFMQISEEVSQLRWEYTEKQDGIEAICFDTSNRLTGFALAGSCVGEREKWVKKIRCTQKSL